MFASFQTVDKVAKPHRVIKRNSIGVPDKLKIWWGKEERNVVFIMNFVKNSFKHGVSFDVARFSRFIKVLISFGRCV